MRTAAYHHRAATVPQFTSTTIGDRDYDVNLWECAKCSCTVSLADYLYSGNLNDVLPAHLQELWAQHKRDALAENSSNTSEESSSTAACDIDTTLQHWHLQSPAIVALQSRGHSSALQTSIFRTVIDLTPRHLKEYAEMNTRLLQLLRNAIQQGDDQSVEAV